jgi:hemolysin D
VLRVVLLFLALTLAWACMAELDVVATAAGRVVPVGRSQPVQAPDGGIVAAVHVRDGQPVDAGDPLIELDVRDWQLDAGRRRSELAAEQLALALAEVQAEVLGTQPTAQWRLRERLDAVLGSRGLAPSTTERAAALSLLSARLSEHREQIAVLARRDAARAADARATEARLRMLTGSLVVLADRASAAETLASRGLIAREQYLERELRRVEADEGLQAARAELAAVREERAAIDAEREALGQGALREVLTEREQRERRVQALQSELAQLEQRLFRALIRAPIDGIVEQLAVRHAGAVLRPAESVLMLVPRAGPLEVEALLPDRDVAFVHAGQTAAVKVDAFDFTRHGLLPARVRALSADAFRHEALGNVYAARIRLERDFFEGERGRAPLLPGMSVQVEIRTGKRRVIDYFLSPLRGAARDSLTER